MAAFVGGTATFSGARVGQGHNAAAAAAPRRGMLAPGRRLISASLAEPQAPRAANRAPFKGKTGLILVNIGTPKSVSVKDVRAYLREFLEDNRVVDVNPILKFILLNFVVLPFRPKESAEAYASIWDKERGSPLLYHTEDLADKLRTKMGDNFEIQIGNQFGMPSVYSALDHMQAIGTDRIIVLPLFPQYASSSTGSAVEIVYKEAAKMYCTPYLHVVPAFYDHSGYIGAYASIIKAKVGPACENYDLLLLSFHGIPETHVTRTDDSGCHCLKAEGCCEAIVQTNRNCYRAQSYETARKLVREIGIPDEKYTVSFQSRLSAAGPEWIKPYTDEVIVKLAKEGYKKVACVVPSFAVDCLETLEEIGIRGQEEFLENGGEQFDLISCLNAEDKWAEGLIEILKDSAPVL